MKSLLDPTMLTDVNAVSPEIWEQIRTNRTIRMTLAKQSQYWFFHIYFSEYVKHPTADFQREIYRLTSDDSLQHVVICAFRGSGKSTIVSLCCPIWSILGSPNKRFVLLLSQTQSQAKMHLVNIRRAFETNELLRKDFGPLEELSDEWGTSSLVLPKYDARISSASVDQGIRGLRHGAHRPDLIIADDVEDMSSTKTREGRDKTYDWFMGEVIPAGDQGTKIINIGNLLHEDSLLMRLKERFEDEKLDGQFYAYPIVNKAGVSLWPGKYPDPSSLKNQERKLGDRKAWEREFMLRIVADERQVIDPRWIRYYDDIPPMDEAHEYINSFMSVDLAISEKTSADCTAAVIVHAYGFEHANRHYYVDKTFLNHRASHAKNMDVIEMMFRSLNGKEDPMLLVEKVAYQAAAVEDLENRGLYIKGIPVKNDKYSRLVLCSKLFERGQVLFPKRDTQVIISQVTGFGVEKHDDLVDALTMALNYIHTKVDYGVLFAWIGPDCDDDDNISSVFYRE